MTSNQEKLLLDILGKMNDYMNYSYNGEVLTINGYIPSFYQKIIDRLKIIKLNIPIKIETSDKILLKFLNKK